jgi:hypothetical protein
MLKGGMLPDELGVKCKLYINKYGKTMKNANSRLYTLYPFLFVFYPVLALLLLNLDKVKLITFARLTLISLALAIVVWLILSLIFRNLWKSALLTLAIEVMFFSYGIEQNLVQGIHGINPFLGGNVFLGSLDLVLLALLTFWVIRTKSNFFALSSFLTYTNVFLILIPLLQIGFHYMAVQKAIAAPGTQESGLQAQADPPDIYFIILDSYSREDLYKSAFGFDNSPFVNQLNGLGFQVMMCSRSNYNATALSLSSMLNMAYEQTLGVEASAVSAGKNPMIPLIQHNEVREDLEKMGYTFYTFDNEFPGLDWPGTTKINPPTQETWASDQLNPTENLFIKNTALKILVDSQVGMFKQIQTTINNPFSTHIKLTQFTLKALPGTASLAGPKFVYAHFLLPHRPFVFDAQGNIRTDTHYFDKDGNPVNDDYYKLGYVGGTEYVNSQMIPILSSILKNSQKPPIIIMMGDHGYAWKDTNFENLISLYLPGNQPSQFYPTITNVNIFRTLFNQYFGGNYRMLPDISYRIDFKKGIYLTVPETQPDCVQPVKK